MDPSPGAQREEDSGSWPLVPLVPAQKRQAIDPELGFKRTSTEFKNPHRSEVLKPVARHARNPWLADASSRMQARHSHPGPGREDLNVELRGTKSAPDLRAPLLAAIRGLKDGSIQVDVRTRAKIANAARRVLEARELRRRTSQEAFQTLNGEDNPATAANSAAATRGNQQQEGGRLPTATSSGHVDSLLSFPAVPTALISSPSFRDLPRAEYRRPPADDVEEALLPSFGELRTGRASPFTVTTGLPKFPTGSGSESPSTPTLTPGRVRTRSTPIPVLQNNRSPEHLPLSLDFSPGLCQAEGRHQNE